MSSNPDTHTSSIHRHENGNIEIKLTIPWSQIDQTYEAKVNEAVEAAELPGFRKGKAPRNLVEPKLDRSNLISQALGDLLPPAYSKAIAAHQIKPILYPQINIDKGKTGEDWEFTAITCEAPSITLPDFKTGLSRVKTKPDQSKLAAAIEYLSQNSQVRIPDLLVEEEANHRLSNLAENLTQISLSMEKYLQTKKISAQDLKAQTMQTSRKDLEIEFVLAEIQAREKLADRDKTVEFIQSLIV